MARALGSRDILSTPTDSTLSTATRNCGRKPPTIIATARKSKKRLAAALLGGQHARAQNGECNDSSASKKRRRPSERPHVVLRLTAAADSGGGDGGGGGGGEGNETTAKRREREFDARKKRGTRRPAGARTQTLRAYSRRRRLFCARRKPSARALSSTHQKADDNAREQRARALKNATKNARSPITPRSPLTRSQFCVTRQTAARKRENSSVARRHDLMTVWRLDARHLAASTRVGARFALCERQTAARCVSKRSRARARTRAKKRAHKHESSELAAAAITPNAPQRSARARRAHRGRRPLRRRPKVSVIRARALAAANLERARAPPPPPQQPPLSPPPLPPPPPPLPPPLRSAAGCNEATRKRARVFLSREQLATPLNVKRVCVAAVSGGKRQRAAAAAATVSKRGSGQKACGAAALLVAVASRPQNARSERQPSSSLSPAATRKRQIASSDDRITPIALCNNDRQRCGDRNERRGSGKKQTIWLRTAFVCTKRVYSIWLLRCDRRLTSHENDGSTI